MHSVLVEQDITTSVMRHMEMTRQVYVLEVLDCFLQTDDVPFPRDVFRWHLLCLVEVQDSSSECRSAPAHASDEARRC